MKTPIVLITGYLGAGKTTLLRHILANTDRKIAILMNEFGQMGIDGELIRGKAVDMIELSGGCVCCSMTGEFEAAINEIREKINPELIIIETTGVAEPDAIVGDILENLPGVRLDAIITLADADSIIRFPSIGHTGRVQIEMADIIIVNKIDLVTPDQLKEVTEKLQDINPHALMINAIRGEINVGNILDIQRTPRALPRHAHPDHLDQEQIESFVYRTEKRLHRARLEVLLTALPPAIIRVKGFAKTDEGDYLANAVFGRAELEPHQANQSELVFIGRNALSHQQKILGELAHCEI